MYNARMTLIDVELAQEPLTIDKFKSVPVDEYPYCLIGFQLKSSYDQERISIKSKYGAKDLVHFLPKSVPVPTFFRGIKLKLKPKYASLLTQLNNYNTSFSDFVKTDVYMSLLSKYNLTCNECYAHLRKGVYPIDGSHLTDLAETDLTLDALYDDAFDTKKIPAFQSFCSFTIFILCNETIFASHRV
jgi:hypothetical protein